MRPSGCTRKAVLLLSLLFDNTSDYSQHNEDSYRADPIDLHFMCPTWAEENRCFDDDDDDDIDKTNVRSVTETCAKSCLVDMMRSYVLSDALAGIEYTTGMDMDENCMDVDDKDSCQAKTSECMVSQEVRQLCPDTCMVCFSSEAISFGVPQDIDPTDPMAFATLQVLKNTIIYMQQQVWRRNDMEHLRRDCRNLYEDCSFRAATGHCQDPKYRVEMQLNCAPACQACYMLPTRKRCPQSDPEDAFLKEGDLNAMFQQIVTEKRPKILSQPDLLTRKLPWILQMDEFVSPEEAEHLIKIGEGIGFEASTAISDNVDEYGEQQRVHQEWRTSETAWCDRNCQDGDAVVNKIVQRILQVIELP